MLCGSKLLLSLTTDINTADTDWQDKRILNKSTEQSQDLHNFTFTPGLKRPLTSIMLLVQTTWSIQGKDSTQCPVLTSSDLSCIILKKCLVTRFSHNTHQEKQNCENCKFLSLKRCWQCFMEDYCHLIVQKEIITRVSMQSKYSQIASSIYKSDIEIWDRWQ